VHLVGFIIRLYNDARSSECQTCSLIFFLSCKISRSVSFETQCWIVSEINNFHVRCRKCIVKVIICFERRQIACPLPIPRLRHATECKYKKMSRKEGPTRCAISRFSRRKVLIVNTCNCVDAFRQFGGHFWLCIRTRRDE